jgi:hypothetical protein
MNRKLFITLGILTVVLAVLAIGVGLQDRWAHRAAPTPRFLPELEARLNDITRLQVQIAGSEPATVERRGDRWVVAEKDGYPADTGLLRRELLTLAQLERVEAMTSKPEKYERLGLRPIDQEGSAARQIKLWAGEQPLVQMLAGKSGPHGETYVRLLDDPQSWLSSATITSPSRPEDWLDKELVSLTPNQIHRVVLQPPTGDTYTLTNPDPNALSFMLEPIPAGKRVKMGEPQRIAGALNALRLTDVVADDKAPQNDISWHSARFEAFDGLVIEARSRKVEDRHYLKLNVWFDEALSQQFRKPTEDEATQPTPALKPVDQVKATAEQLNNRFKDWTFIIPDFTAELFNISEDQLLEDELKAEEESPALPDQTLPESAQETPVIPDQTPPIPEAEPSKMEEPPAETQPAEDMEEQSAPPVEAQPVEDDVRAEDNNDQPQPTSETTDTPSVETADPADPVDASAEETPVK